MRNIFINPNPPPNPPNPLSPLKLDKRNRIKSNSRHFRSSSSSNSNQKPSAAQEPEEEAKKKKKKNFSEKKLIDRPLSLSPFIHFNNSVSWCLLWPVVHCSAATRHFLPPHTNCLRRMRRRIRRRRRRRRCWRSWGRHSYWRHTSSDWCVCQCVNVCYSAIVFDCTVPVNWLNS